ncbi:MAG: non-homologous end-joining DNA ligase [Mycobacterium sp.]
MLATPGQPPSRFDEFAVEAKFDGQRGIAILDHDRVTLLSRNGADVTRTFPEIASALPGAVDRSVILDGEIVALDTKGIPSFERLQRRWPHSRRPSVDLLRAVPVRFFAFDVLRHHGQDVTNHPYAERREILADVAAAAQSSVIQFPHHWVATDPSMVLAASAETGLEGIVTKRLDSLYLPGVRSKDWIKTCHRLRSEFVIGGWLPGEGPNHRTIGALLVGAHDDQGRLRFCGPVGAGISAAHRRILTRYLAPLASLSSPFDGDIPAAIARNARWVRAETIGDIEYRELRGLLRHPSWKGIRADLTDVTRVVLPSDITELHA